MIPKTKLLVIERPRRAGKAELPRLYKEALRHSHLYNHEGLVPLLTAMNGEFDKLMLLVAGTKDIDAMRQMGRCLSVMGKLIDVVGGGGE